MTDIEEALEIIWDRCQHCKDVKEALDILRGERQRGEWMINVSDVHQGQTCSICGRTYLFYELPNYCPNCGARMQKEGGAECMSVQ